MRKVSGLSCLACILVVFPVVVQAHEGKPHQLGDLWFTWAFDPLILTGLAVSAPIYLIGLRRLW